MALRSDVVLVLGDGCRAAELLDDIYVSYDVVFSQPPFRWTDEESVTTGSRSSSWPVARPSAW